MTTRLAWYANTRAVRVVRGGNDKQTECVWEPETRSLGRHKEKLETLSCFLAREKVKGPSAAVYLTVSRRWWERTLSSLCNLMSLSFYSFLFCKLDIYMPYMLRSGYLSPRFQLYRLLTRAIWQQKSKEGKKKKRNWNCEKKRLAFSNQRGFTSRRHS